MKDYLFVKNSLESHYFSSQLFEVAVWNASACSSVVSPSGCHNYYHAINQSKGCSKDIKDLPYVWRNASRHIAKLRCKK